MNKHTHCALGFTLVELMAVIAIIMLLMAIMVPGVQNAMDAGRQAGCSTHLRQLGALATTWSSERGGIIIPNSLIVPDHLPIVGATQRFWDWELMAFHGVIDSDAPYSMHGSPLRGKRPPSFFACPASDYLVHGPSQTVPEERATTDFGKNFHTSQGRNWATPPGLQIVRYGAVSEPSRVMLAVDGWGADVANAGWHTEDMGIAFRHRGGTTANVLFLDGHVEARTFADLKSRPWDVHPWRDRAP